MELKKTSSRQIIIFYLIYSAAIKFLMLPHFLSNTAGRDGWISALLGSLVELLLLFTVIKSIQKEEDIYSTLRKKTSHVGAKIVFAVLLAFFLLQILIALKQTNFLLEQYLYENLDFTLFAIAMAFFGVAFCYAPTRSIFRSGEIFYVLVIAALALALLPALDKADPAEVLPVFDNGAKPILEAVYRNLIYFESAAVLFLFKGDIKTDKTFTRRFMIWACIGIVVFVAFVFLYYSMFGPLTVTRPASIINITQQSSYITQNGRLEWIIICVWLILLLLRFGVTFFACFACLRYITHVKFQPAAIAFPLALVIFIIHAFIIKSITDLEDFIAAILPAIAVFYLLVPFIAFLSGGRKKNV